MNLKVKKHFPAFQIIILTILIIILLFFNVYSLVLNETNHTGFDPYILAYFFSITGALAMIAVMFQKILQLKTYLALFISILLLSIAGTVNIVLFVHYNIMMSYEVWCEKGMPGKYEISEEVLK